MYGKLFASMFQGTLRGKANEILVFANLIATANKYGEVDKHWKAIAEETGLSEDEVRKAIDNLMSPDPESRSVEHEGRRIICLDQNRKWGWQIVNYAKYRAISSEEDRRIKNAIYQKQYREKVRLQSENLAESHEQKTLASSDGEFTPPTLEQVQSYGESALGADARKAELFWLECQASDWIGKNGRPMKAWQWSFKAWLNRFEQNEAERARRSSHRIGTAKPQAPKQSWADAKREIEEKIRRACE